MSNTQKTQLNQAICMMLVAGENTEFIEGHVYAKALSLGIDHDTWMLAIKVAALSGVIEGAGEHQYRTTQKGLALCEQVKQFYNLKN